MAQIYVIGHKNPDNDSIFAPIALAYLLNQTDQENEYIPASAGELRDVTKHILDKFDIKHPQKINGEGKKLILVDHNEKTQQVDGAEKAELLGIYDHHKINFSYHTVIPIRIEVIGSSSSIIYKMYKEKNIEIPQNIASILLAGILDDTVILTSPTTTEEDKNIVEELSQKTGLNYEDFGKEIFKIKSNISQKTAREIITTDMKEMNFSDKHFAIGQAETTDIKGFESRIDEIKEELQKIKQEKNYHTIILFITDILKHGSLFLVFSDEPELFEKAFNKKLINNQVFIEGIMSRKKQVVPPLNTIIT